MIHLRTCCFFLGGGEGEKDTPQFFSCLLKLNSIIFCGRLGGGVFSRLCGRLGGTKMIRYGYSSSEKIWHETTKNEDGTWKQIVLPELQNGIMTSASSRWCSFWTTFAASPLHGGPNPPSNRRDHWRRTVWLIVVALVGGLRPQRWWHQQTDFFHKPAWLKGMGFVGGSWKRLLRFFQGFLWVVCHSMFLLLPLPIHFFRFYWMDTYPKTWFIWMENYGNHLSD